MRTAPSFRSPCSIRRAHIELLAQVEDTHDGVFQSPPPNGNAVRPNAGPVTIAPLTYQLSEESIRVRELADKAMRQIATRRGLARFMKLTETRGVYCAHPLGGCRMADDKEHGVVDHAARRSTTRASSASTRARSRPRSA